MAELSRKCLLGLLLGVISIPLWLNQTSSQKAMSGNENATIRVDAAVGNDSPDCGTAEKTCRTIQYAIDLANSGDVVLVAGGIYNSPTT